MQAPLILVKVKSATSLKSLNFTVDPNSSLKAIRQQLSKLQQIQLDQYIFLMDDKSPISKSSQQHVLISMLLDSNKVFYVQEKIKKNIKPINNQYYNTNKFSCDSAAPSPDIEMQIKYNQKTKIYNQFQQKIQQLKLKLVHLNNVFATKINALPKIDSHYQGQINQFGLYEGIGRYVYANSQVYIGQFANGVRSGLGAYTFKNGDRYQGQYKDNVACGLGTEIFTTGNSMAAIYKKNNANGIGIYYFKDGAKLLGNFVQNNFQGEGLKLFCDGTWKMEKYHQGDLVNN